MSKSVLRRILVAAVAPIGTVTAGADGTLRLPGIRLSRPGRMLIVLTDETGAKRYVAIQVRRPR